MHAFNHLRSFTKQLPHNFVLRRGGTVDNQHERIYTVLAEVEREPELNPLGEVCQPAVKGSKFVTFLRTTGRVIVIFVTVTTAIGNFLFSASVIIATLWAVIHWPLITQIMSHIIFP
jgi:hypothetical protein